MRISDWSSDVCAADLVAAHDDLALTALAAAVKAAGSLVIGLALLRGRLDAAEAFRLSQLAELYQAERWGEEAEAAKRREALSQEIEAADRSLEVVGAGLMLEYRTECLHRACRQGPGQDQQGAA